MQTISLHCIFGPLAGQVFHLSGGPLFLFGRYSRAHFNLSADPSASHLHFAVDISEKRVRIADLGSMNGIVINDRHYAGKNGSPLTEFVTLKNGDIILAGACMFRLAVKKEKGRGVTTDPGARPEPTEDISPQNPRDTIVTNTSAKLVQPDGGEEKEEEPFPEIDGFSIIAKIGGGGKGAVYKAIKNDTGVAAAIKLLLSTTNASRRPIEIFRREVLIAKQLSHPNIIRYLGDGMANGDPYLALEFVGGGTLEEFIATEPDRRLDLPRAVPLFIQILEAIAYMHSLSLAHRDIKPRNILLDIRRGGSLAAKLSDMGLSCRFTSQNAPDLFPIIAEGGTPAYMPPEQLLDVTRAMPQSDIFSAAATFYHMLSGSLLYTFSGRDKKDAIIEGNIKPILYLRPNLPIRLANVISKGLSYNPENRYANAQEMLEALKQSLA